MLQETAKKKAFYDKTSFNSIEISYVCLCVILGMKGLIYENDQGCKRQPQATGNSKEQSFVWQNKVQQYWNITNLNFGVILGMKGLIYENAQGWQLGTLLYFGKGPPSYKKQQRKKWNQQNKVWHHAPRLPDFTPILPLYINFDG